MITIECKEPIKLKDNILIKYSAFIKFDYRSDIVDYIKSLPIRFYFPDTHTWEIPINDMPKFCNKFEDECINIQGTCINMQNDNDIELPKDFEFKTKPFPHQIDGVKFGLNRPKFLLCDEQGCVSKDTIIQVNYRKNSRKMTIENLYKKFQNAKYPNDFKIRCLLDGHYGLNKMNRVIYSGYKDVYKLITNGGKELKCTKDHPILTPDGYKALEFLNINDTIIVNGKNICKICGSDKDIITHSNSKFLGYCRKCMYKNRRGTKYEDDEIGKRLGTDGYYYITGKEVRDKPRYKTGSLTEHVYIMEKHLGRYLNKNEQVHHINGNKQDNRLENLMIVTPSEHHKLHHKENNFGNYINKSGNEVITIPKEDKIKSIEYVGKEDVYDIQMESPYNNFVANGIVVHNCGKTKQVIDWVECLDRIKPIQHALIICGVNSLKYNWQQEVKVHSNETAYVLGTRQRKNGNIYEGSRQDKLDDLDNLPKDKFIITNIETLRAGAEKIGKGKYTFPIAEKIKELCNKGIINVIAYDECHKSKDPSSLQGKAMSLINSEYMVAMSGTPLMNNPLDLYFPLHWLGYETHSFYQFKMHYCRLGGYMNSQVVGFKNLDEIKTNLGNIMIRRLKNEVLDLPEKIHQIEYVDMTPKQSVIYKEVQQGIMSNLTKLRFANNPLSMLIRLRQATGYTGIISDKVKESAKINRLLELVEELHESGKKCIVFSNWTNITEVVRDRLKSYHPAYITGETDNVERMKEVDRFQNDPKCEVIIGTIGAMGTGLTLTAAQTVIFMDSPWTRALKDQAEDRCHRIGTTGTVNVITIVAKNTIDERIEEIINRKGAISDALVDNKVSMEDIKFLLS